MLGSSSSHSTTSSKSRARARSASKLKDGDKATAAAATKKPDQRSRHKGVTKFRNSIKSLFTKTEGEQVYTFVMIGATSEVAKRKAYPALWNLFKSGQLPKNTRFFGFARTATTKDELRDRCDNNMTVAPAEAVKYEEFWKANNYYVGSYLARIDYDVLNKDLANLDLNNNVSNRLFYIAVPNSMLESVIQNLRTLCQPKCGWTRVIAEKPFGKDPTSSTRMTLQMLTLCSEDDLYRVDPYLGKDIVQNILTIRFCNLLFSSTWNRKMIENVMITIKEPGGVYGKGKYFDSYGIICDVMQLHLVQLLALVAMEKPISMRPDDIRDEKVKLLKCIAPVSADDVVLGQYVANPNAPEGAEARSNYFDDPDVAHNSNTPTFCTAVLRVHNERWDGVPFVLKCGKALDERRCEIRVRYQNVPADIFECRLKHNEFVIQVEPEERLFVRAVTRAECYPASMHHAVETLVPLDTSDAHASPTKADAYENIVRSAFGGAQCNFIRTAELKQAWRIFTPLLEKIDKEGLQPVKYSFGSDGPADSDRLIKRYTDYDETNRTRK